uniref:HWTX-XIII n=1 Tax=Cyriopagopus schmidti TaxID=29017 RepID=B3FIV0_CYRSC|nr:HWTX-XIII precursor [Cyriopagopus schmidti]
MKYAIVLCVIVIVVTVVRATHLKDDESGKEFEPLNLREERKCKPNGQKCESPAECCSMACSSDKSCEEVEHTHLHFG